MEKSTPRWLLIGAAVAPSPAAVACGRAASENAAVGGSGAALEAAESAGVVA